MSRLLITMKDGDPRNKESGVFDMDTGEKISGVVSVDIRRIDPDTSFVLAEITTFCSLNIEYDATIDGKMQRELFTDPNKPRTVMGKVTVSVKPKKFRLLIAAIRGLFKVCKPSGKAGNHTGKARTPRGRR